MFKFGQDSLMQVVFTREEFEAFTEASLRRDFSNYIQPCKYEFWKDSVCLYAGHGKYKRGILRAFEIGYLEASKRTAVSTADRVVIDFYGSDDDALDAEQESLYTNRPLFNKNGTGPFSTKHRMTTLFTRR